MRGVLRFALRVHRQNVLVVLLLIQQALGLFRRHPGNPGCLLFPVRLPRFLAILILTRLILLLLFLLVLILFALARL